MRRFGAKTATATRVPVITSRAWPRFILAAAALGFLLGGAQARTETPEEVGKILSFLEKENCEIARDAMGEKKLSLTGSNFVVDATCSDGKSYRFTLDQNLKVLEKKAGKY